MQAAEVILDSQGGRIEVWPHGRPANGAHYRFEWFLAPRTAGLPEHFHPHQEEKLQVISGRLLVRLEGQEVALGPGDRLVIAAGTRHSCGNSGPTRPSRTPVSSFSPRTTTSKKRGPSPPPAASITSLPSRVNPKSS